MSCNKLGNFFENNIEVKLIKNSDISHFKNNGYCDFRIGCSLCGFTVATFGGLKTNILNIIDNSNNWFYLNNLDLEFKDTWYEDMEGIYLQNLYETNNIKVIDKVYKYFNKFIKLHNNRDLYI